MFHNEFCIFAAFLSTGKDHTDCGRPCDRHKVELRDRVGATFPVVADTGCRNTVFNSVAQSAAEYVGRMRDLGLTTGQRRDWIWVGSPLLDSRGSPAIRVNRDCQGAGEQFPKLPRHNLRVALGLTTFRIDLLRENAEQAKQLLDRYARVIAGVDDGRATWRELRVLNQLGVTRGTLQVV